VPADDQHWVTADTRRKINRAFGEADNLKCHKCNM